MSTPIGAAPIQEATASTPERPGALNNGRIILLKRTPINSVKPKFKRMGIRNPAKKNNTIKTGNTSFNNMNTVYSLTINSEQNLKYAITINRKPINIIVLHNNQSYS